jgi:hypothetical protein
MLSSLPDGVLVALRDPYGMLKSILTHTSDISDAEYFWRSGLPVLIPVFIWVFVEVVIWMKKR